MTWDWLPGVVALQLLQQLEQNDIGLQLERQRNERALAEARLDKMFAQAGLAPYVYALQLLNEWLAKNPSATGKQVRAQMASLQIANIRLGLDPRECQRNAPWWPRLMPQPRRKLARKGL